ncbi:hypothetical protein [Nocardiopsis potens]|uniref:hypothetical protein n=1 Tax=Nocardiopsis potens TaxID=1246458 RepID=UPI000374CBD3|nr:hypothetical protein [Nocardiopsis potens]
MSTERDRTASAMTLTLPEGFASWLTGTGAISAAAADPFHASAQQAMAAARVGPTGEVEVSCDAGGLCVIGEQAYRLAHTPGIPDDLLDAALTALDRFHSAMNAWSGREGMCVDCGGGGRAPGGAACPQCTGSGRVPTGW